MIPDNEYDESLEQKGADHEDIMNLKCFSEFKRQDSLLKPEESNASFLLELQSVHDSDLCWDTKGLSPYGYTRLTQVGYKYRLRLDAVIDHIFARFETVSITENQQQ